MPGSAHSPDPRLVEQTWGAIERDLEDLAVTARSDCSEDAFYSLVTERLSSILGGGAAAWKAVRGAARWQRLDVSTLGPDSSWRPPSESPSALAEPTAGGAGDPFELESTCRLLAPVSSHGQVVAAIELRAASVESAAEACNRRELLAACCELASEFADRQHFRAAQAELNSYQSLDDFAAAVHGQLDLLPVCYAIANEARRLMGCDRVSVVTWDRRGSRLRAMSGVDDFDRRAAEVRHLERLAAAAAQTEETIWYDGDTASFAEPTGILLSELVDHTTSRSVGVVPLIAAAEGKSQERRERRTCSGVLVFESFAGGFFNGPPRRTAGAIARHSSLAIANAQRFARIPWLLRLPGCGLSEVLHRRGAILSILAGALLAAIGTLLLVETDFEIHCRGQLQPATQRDVFASETGLIRQLLVDSGDDVAGSDPLVVLTNSDLDYELSRISGELQTHRSQLRSVQANRKTRPGAASGSDWQEQRLQLAADEARLSNTIAGLEEQLKLLRRRASGLTARSPIAGRVLTPDLQRRLASRPVRQGERLLTIAAVDADWELELKIADRDIGHVLAAQRAVEEPALPIQYMLAAEPASVYGATLSSLGRATETSPEFGTFVRGTVTIDRDLHTALRPGATVVARINCGRRSLAFVWLHDAWESLRRNFFW